MFMSLRFAPSSFELMLLSFTSPVLRCFDIVIKNQITLLKLTKRTIITISLKTIKTPIKIFQFVAASLTFSVTNLVQRYQSQSFCTSQIQYKIMIKTNRCFSLGSNSTRFVRPSSIVSKRYQAIPLSSSDPKSQTIQIGSYKAQKEDLLGKGFCSKVYKAVDEKTGQEVALKVIDLLKIKSVVHRRFLKNQLTCLRRLQKTKNIINLIQTIQTKSQLTIITQLCQHSVAQLMKKSTGQKQPLPIQTASKIFTQIVQGYLSMYSAGLIHRDIKPANILIGFDGIAKICDLGFATRYDKVKEDRFVNVGSPLYMAPEVMKDNQYSSKADIWAIGVLMLEMINGGLPWDKSKQKQLRQVIIKTDFEELLPSELDLQWKVIILKCLEVNPLKRCGPVEMMKMINPDYQPEPEQLQDTSKECFEEKEQIDEQSILPKPLTITSIATTHTQPIQYQEFEERNKIQSVQNSRVKQFSLSKSKPYKPPTAQKIAQRINTALPNSLRTSLKSFSSKKLIKDFDQNILALKLNPSQSPCQTPSKQALLKKQQYSNLHLCRFMFKIIQQIQKTQDNIHCTYLDIENSFVKDLAFMILGTIQDIKEIKSIYEEEVLQQFRKSKEYRSLYDITTQYENNYRQYFSLKLQLNHHKFNFNFNPVQKLSFYLQKAHQHATMVFEEIFSSELQEINDQQLCQFILLLDSLHSLQKFVKLKNINPNVFIRTNRIEQLLKKDKMKLKIDEIYKINKRLSD